MKDMGHSAQLALADLLTHGGVWSFAYSGVENHYGVKEYCIGLPETDTSWRFSQFSFEQYESAYKNVLSGFYTVYTNIDAYPDVSIGVDYLN